MSGREGRYYGDLFGDGGDEHYPDIPGWKEGETSREAAEDMAARAGTLRRLCLDYLKVHPLHTSDEVAEALDESPLAIRPRISELRVRGLIVNDGRGINISGKAAHRWRLTVRGDDHG